MSTPIISDISDEHSELEGIVKLEPDEKELKSPQYVNETDERTDQDPEDEYMALKDLPHISRDFTTKWYNSKPNSINRVLQAV